MGDSTWFPIEPGVYTYAMYFLPVSPGVLLPRGGDVTAVLCRKDEEPEKWTLVVRSRFYNEETAWGDKDRRAGWTAILNGPEQVVGPDALAKMRAFASQMANLGAGPLEVLDIRGGPEQFLAAVERDKPDWLHFSFSIDG